MRVCFSVLLIALFFVSACSKKNDKCDYNPCSAVAPDSEVKQVEAYLSSNTITAVKHCSGLYYQVISEGTGSNPTSCSAISVTYKGTLTNGNVFENATTPVVYGLATLIEGWRNGLPVIKKGGRIKLFVPPSLGYGASSQGSIPGNSVLIFDINLLDVQ